MANLQQARRTNPYPWSWEIPVGVTTVAALILVVTAHAARSIANWLAGAPWAFTESRAIFTSLPAILTGDPTAGVADPPLQHASSTAVIVWVIVLEVVVTVVATWAGIIVLRRFGNGRIKGMASASEVEKVLGLTRLRQHAHIVRPDLHPQHRRTRR